MKSLWVIVFSFWMLILNQAYADNANPLPAKQAFKFTYNINPPENISIDFVMPKGYFLYKDKIKLSTEDSDSLTIGSVQYPKTSVKKDALGNIHNVYFNKLSLIIPIISHVSSAQNILEIQYQGCSDQGFCYPPQKQKITLYWNQDKELTNNYNAPPINSDTTDNTNNQENINQPVIKTTSTLMFLLSFYGIGLLLAFTPCVLPMIPVISALILRRDEKVNSKQAFSLTLSYVLGLSTAYALIGLCFALLGQNLQILFQSFWMHAILAILFLVLAMGMFDFYNIRPPESWQAWFQALSNKKQSHAYISSAILGAISILVLSPCVTPPLVGILAYITQSGNVFLGSLALFVLGLGSGTPLLLMSTSAAYLIPKTGHWMNVIKNTFGILLLAVSIQLIHPDLPASLSMALWGAFLMTLGTFMGAFTTGFTPLEKIKQTFGIIALLYGSLLIIGASMGNSNLWSPLAQAKSSSGSEIYATRPNVYEIKHKVSSSEELNNLLSNKLANTPVILDFYADWCTECRYLESQVWSKITDRELDEIVKITVDLSKNNAETKQLMTKYEVIAPPTFVILNAKHIEIKKFRKIGNISREEILTLNKYFKARNS